MVSFAVDTAAPEDVAPLPVFASALVAALRAELLLALAAALVLAAAVAGRGLGSARSRCRPAHCSAPYPTRRRPMSRHKFHRRRRILRVARIDLHNHVILVDGAVDDRHLALAECVIERVVDLRRRDAQPGRHIAVDDEVGFKPRCC